MDLCRNCGSETIRELGFVGELAPFFLKRVFSIEMGKRKSRHPLKQLLRQAAGPGRKYLSQLYGDAAFIEMQVCHTCSFVQAKHPFSDEAIARLYLDYRSDSYNIERIRFEPTYKAIADRIGSDRIEATTRVDRVTNWISDKIELNDEFTMLDFGGADGRFLPSLPGKKYVYELSNIQPLPGITRISAEAQLASYSYIHLAHVLEHVVNPLELVRHVSQYMKNGAYLYIEVPQELRDSDIQALKTGTYKLNLSVHEHINQYSLEALSQVVTKAGIRLLATQKDEVNLGWSKGTHLRALGMRH